MRHCVKKTAIRASTFAAWAWICILLLQSAPAFALANPTITGQASTPALVGGTLTDTATLAGGTAPTGTITFQLVQGGTCGTKPIFTSTKTVGGNGSYTSDSFGPLAAGFYSWLVSYSGDAANNPTSTVCDDGSDSVVVPQYCPSHACSVPPSCAGSNITNTTSESTLECVGNPAQTNVSVVTVIGPATLCTGTDKSVGFCVVAGGQDIDTNVETVTPASVVTIPTLSIWGLGILFVGLGALALRRLAQRDRSETAG
jgi:hypothetical protein